MFKLSAKHVCDQKTPPHKPNVLEATGRGGLVKGFHIAIYVNSYVLYKYKDQNPVIIFLEVCTRRQTGWFVFFCKKCEDVSLCEVGPPQCDLRLPVLRLDAVLV